MIRKLLSFACTMIAASAVAQNTQWVYFGTYTTPESGSKGVYVAKFDATTGVLSAPVVAAETTSPSFLALHPSGQFLYTVGESAPAGRVKSEVSAYRISRSSGKLDKLNAVEAGGEGPCFIGLEKGGTVAMTAQYTDGTVASHRVASDGRLGEAVSVIKHVGTGPDAERQEGPHAHSIRATPDNRFALACDLGADKVFIYRIDTATGALTKHGHADLPPGAGPRHIAFHPNGRLVFVNNEMLMSVSVFEYEAKQGRLNLLRTVSTLPEADRKLKGLSTAEVVVHPNGRVVYVSNRTHDTIAVFRCEPETGALELVQNVPAEGKIPRNFSLDLSGKWMIVAHQDSNSAAIFSVNEKDGTLAFTGKKVSLGAPVCVRFLAAE
jgi:6-phosphogluconolactonase